MKKQIFSFALVGVAGFIADAGVLYALLHFGLNPYVSRLFSFVFAVLVTWLLNRHYTFTGRKHRSLWREWLDYLLAMSFGGACNYAIYAALVASLPPSRLTPLIALAFASLAGMVVNFTAARLWVFRHRPGAPARPAGSSPLRWLALTDRFVVGPRIVWAFVVIAIPYCIFFAMATPPFQTPDASNHFFRAYQVSRGVPIGKKIEGSSGGMVDSGVIAFGALDEPLKFHPERKWTRALEEVASAARLTGQERPQMFPNTAPYPPLNYVPQAIALDLLRLADAPLLTTYRFVCLLNAICAIAMTAAALRIARRTRPVIFLIGLLPMTTTLMASVSQDATLIPLGFLIVACYDHLCSTGKAMTRTMAIALALLIISAAVARIPYILFVLLFFHPSVRMSVENERYAWIRRIAWSAATCVISAVIYMAQTHLASGNVRDGRSMSGQTRYLLSHLTAIPELMHQTLLTYGRFYAHSFIGVLGWLDTYYPNGVYAVGTVLIILALLLGGARRDAADQGRPGLIAALVPLFTFIGACALIFYGLYAFWSAVGAKEIEGVQGRYFTPVFPVMAMAVVPFVRAPLSETPLLTACRGVVAFAIIGYPVVLFFYTVHVMLVRYYIG